MGERGRGFLEHDHVLSRFDRGRCSDRAGYAAPDHDDVGLKGFDDLVVGDGRGRRLVIAVAALRGCARFVG